MQQTIHISTPSHNGLYDITRQLEALISESGVQTGIVNVYVQGATTGIMEQENWDESVQNDVVALLNKFFPTGVWGSMVTRTTTGMRISKQELLAPRKPFPSWIGRWDSPPSGISSCVNLMVHAAAGALW